MEDLDKNLADLTAAIAKNDEKAIAAAALPIIVGFFKDVRRIADATEKLASFELHRVGDIVTAGATK